MDILASYSIRDFGAPGSLKPRFQVAQVHDLKKEKSRHEAVVAADKQGLSIIGLQNSDLITSYLVSTETTFTCPPISVHAKNGDRIFRTSYASVSAPGSRIIRFVEESKDGADHRISKNEYRLPLSSSSICFLHLEPLSKDESVLLAFYRNGEVLVLSEDLSVEQHRESLGTHLANPSQVAGGNPSIEVEYVQRTSRGGHAQVNGSAVVPSTTPIEFAIISSAASASHSLEAQRRLCDVRFSVISHLGSSAVHINCLRKLVLPPATLYGDPKVTPKIQYHVDSQARQLLRRSGQELSTIELTDSKALLKSESELPAGSSTSWCPVSAGLSILTGQGTVSLHSRKFNAMVTNKPDQFARSISSKKRKANGRIPYAATELFFVDRKLKLAIGKCGAHIIGIPFQVRHSGNTPDDGQDTLLSSLGRGMQTVQRNTGTDGTYAGQMYFAIGNDHPSSFAPIRQHTTALKTLSSLSEQRDSQGFDTAFFELGFGRKMSTTESLTVEEFVKKHHELQVTDEDIIEVLRMIFDLELVLPADRAASDDPEYLLRIKLLASGTLRLLLLTSILSLRLLQRALQPKAQSEGVTLDDEALAQHFLHSLEAVGSSDDLLDLALGSQLQLPLPVVVDSAAYHFGQLQDQSLGSGLPVQYGLVDTDMPDASSSPSPAAQHSLANGVKSSQVKEPHQQNRRTLDHYLRRILAFPEHVASQALSDRLGGRRLMQLLEILTRDTQLLINPSALSPSHSSPPPLSPPDSLSSPSGLSMDELLALTSLTFSALSIKSFPHISTQTHSTLPMLLTSLKYATSLAIEDCQSAEDAITAIDSLETYSHSVKTAMKPTDEAPIELLNTEEDPALTAPWGSIVRYIGDEERDWMLPLGLKDPKRVGKEIINAGGEIRRPRWDYYEKIREEQESDFVFERICI